MSSEPRFGWRPDLDPESTPSRPVETTNEPVPATDGGRLAGADPDAAPGETSELTRAAIRLWSPTPDAPTAEERARAARRLSATPALYAGAVVLIAMVLTAYGYWGREQPARSAEPTVTQTASGGESRGGPSIGPAAVGLAPTPTSAASPTAAADWGTPESDPAGATPTTEPTGGWGDRTGDAVDETAGLADVSPTQASAGGGEADRPAKTATQAPLASQPTPAPTATPTPSPTASATATATPAPTATPSPTPTTIAEPTPSATASPTPSLTATPAPTATETATPTATPEPRETPTPGATPAPTATPSPTASPSPTGTPSPTTTPAPTATPSPTGTPQPSPTATATAQETPTPPSPTPTLDPVLRQPRVPTPSPTPLAQSPSSAASAGWGEATRTPSTSHPGTPVAPPWLSLREAIVPTRVIAESGRADEDPAGPPED